MGAVSYVEPCLSFMQYWTMLLYPSNCFAWLPKRFGQVEQKTSMMKLSPEIKIKLWWLDSEEIWWPRMIRSISKLTKGGWHHTNLVSPKMNRWRNYFEYTLLCQGVLHILKIHHLDGLNAFPSFSILRTDLTISIWNKFDDFSFCEADRDSNQVHNLFVLEIAEHGIRGFMIRTKQYPFKKTRGKRGQ